MKYIVKEPAPEVTRAARKGGKEPLMKTYEYSVQSSGCYCIGIPSRAEAYRKAREYSILYRTAYVHSRDRKTGIRKIIAKAHIGKVYTFKEAYPW